MKNIFFVAPDSVGIISLIKESLLQQREYSIDYLDLVLPATERFRYKSITHRALNFILKNLTRKNLKTIFYNEQISKKIAEAKESYDAIIIIRPDLLTDKTLALLRKKTNHFVAYYWDSVAFFPRKQVISSFFDRVFSFDVQDCRNYGYELLTNFYFFEMPSPKRKYQVYSLLTYDKRKSFVEKIASEFQKASVSYCIKAYSQKPFLSNYITCITKVIDYKVTLLEISQSDVLLEVQKEGQHGLTFRPFESLGLEKKLITNNQMIKEYDFYCENNIYIINPEKIDIPDSFFTTPYQKIDPAIKEKYHFRNWFNTLISKIPGNFAE